MPANVSIGDLVATTARNYSSTFEDNVTNHNAFARRLKQRGNIEYGVSGRTIAELVLYGTNNSAQWYDGYDTFTPPTTGQEVIDAAEFPWRQFGVFVSISGKEQRMNRGEEGRIRLIRARIKQAEAVAMNSFAASLFSDGTAFSGKQLQGLLAAVPDNPNTGTYGGIDRSLTANAFWRSRVSAAVATTSANITTRMNNMWLQTVRGSDAVDLIVAGDTMYQHYEESLQSIQRVASPELADAGFTAIRYKGADVVYDNNCGANRMYFLNTDNLFIRAATSELFETESARKIANADYEIVPMFAQLNLATNRAAAHGVILAS
jgi:hypothetical protein